MRTSAKSTKGKPSLDGFAQATNTCMQQFVGKIGRNTYENIDGDLTLQIGESMLGMVDGLAEFLATRPQQSPRAQRKANVKEEGGIDAVRARMEEQAFRVKSALRSMLDLGHRLWEEDEVRLSGTNA